MVFFAFPPAPRGPVPTAAQRAQRDARCRDLRAESFRRSAPSTLTATGALYLPWRSECSSRASYRSGLAVGTRARCCSFWQKTNCPTEGEFVVGMEPNLISCKPLRRSCPRMRDRTPKPPYRQGHSKTSPACIGSVRQTEYAIRRHGRSAPCEAAPEQQRLRLAVDRRKKSKRWRSPARSIRATAAPAGAARLVFLGRGTFPPFTRTRRAAITEGPRASRTEYWGRAKCASFLQL
jgi:hypothetical protein